MFCLIAFIFTFICGACLIAEACVINSVQYLVWGICFLSFSHYYEREYFGG